MDLNLYTHSLHSNSQGNVQACRHMPAGRTWYDFPTAIHAESALHPKAQLAKHSLQSQCRRPLQESAARQSKMLISQKFAPQRMLPYSCSSCFPNQVTVSSHCIKALQAFQAPAASGLEEVLGSAHHPAQVHIARQQHTEAEQLIEAWAALHDALLVQLQSSSAQEDWEVGSQGT